MVLTFKNFCSRLGIGMKHSVAVLFIFFLMHNSCIYSTSPYKKTPVKTYYSHRKSIFPDRYIDRVQHQLDDILGCLAGLETEIPIVGQIRDLQNQSTMNAVLKLLRSLQEVSADVDQDTMDSIHTACLYKLIVPLIIRYNDLLLNHIAEIDDRLTFWMYAQEHTAHYFFRKNPQKWFISNQAKEVEEHVVMLRGLKEKYHYTLGLLVKHIDTLSFETPYLEQYQWILELCNQINGVASEKNEPIQEFSFTTIAELISTIITHISQTRKNLQSEIEPYCVPSWIERNWMMALGATGSLLWGTPHIVRNSDKIAAAGKSVGDAAKLYGTHLADALWGNDQKQMQELANQSKELQALYEMTLLKMLPEYVEKEEDRLAVLTSIIEKKFQEHAYDLKIDDLEKINFPELEGDSKETIDDIKKICTQETTSFIGRNPTIKFDEKQYKEKIAARTKIKEDEQDAKRIAYKEIIAVVKSNKNFSLDVLRQSSGLSKKDIISLLYGGIYKSTELPQVKRCLDQIDREKLAKFDEKNIKKAAYGQNGEGALDTTYLSEVVFPIIAQTYSIELEVLQDCLEKATDILVNETEGEGGKNLRRVLNEVVPEWIVAKDKTEKKDLTTGIIGALEACKPAAEFIKTIAQSPNHINAWSKLYRHKANEWWFEKYKQSKLFIFLVVGYLIFKAGQDISYPFRVVAQKLKPVTSYDDILGALQELMLLFNVYGSASFAQMEPHDIGLMHYLIDKLQALEYRVPKQYQESFRNNVRLLSASDLTALQKYNIINDAILRRYQFLKSAAMA